MSRLTRVAGHCDDRKTCPQIFVSDRHTMIVQGYVVDDEGILSEAAPPPGERLVEIPRSVLLGAASSIRAQAMTEAEFDGLFEKSQVSVFRLETLSEYRVDQENARFEEFARTGRLVPRSEDNSWLRQISTSTRNGQQWSRVHVVSEPLTTYLQFELLSYRETAAAGFDTKVARRETHSSLASLREDFWLFDGDARDAVVALMVYDADGRYSHALRSEDPDVLARCRAQRDLAIALAVPLETYLSEANLGHEAVFRKAV